MGRSPHLTPEQAAEVRELYAGGKWTIMQLARSFEVQYATISAALRRTGAYRLKPHDPSKETRR